MAALAPIAMRWVPERRFCVLLRVARVHWPNAIQTQENPPNRGLNGRTWVDIDTNRIDMSMVNRPRYRARSTLQTGPEADKHVASYATNSTLLWMGWVGYLLAVIMPWQCLGRRYHHASGEPLSMLL